MQIILITVYWRCQYVVRRVMLNWKTFIALLFVTGLLVACTTEYSVGDFYCKAPLIIEPEDVILPPEEEDFDEDDCPCGVVDDFEEKCVECPCNKNICKQRQAPNVTAGSVPICPPRMRCPEGRLPPQPCAQPIPAYYMDVSQEELAKGIVLIHPYTRTQVLCYDQECESAVDCAQEFRAKGYVLITDLPQQPAKYDFLKPGAYPSRRWRNGGEVHPRW